MITHFALLILTMKSCDGADYDVPVFSKDNGKTYKCTMCHDRLTAELPTACSAACPSVAIFSGPADEVIAEAEKRAEHYSKVRGVVGIEQHLQMGQALLRTGAVVVPLEEIAHERVRIRMPGQRGGSTSRSCSTSPAFPRTNPSPPRKSSGWARAWPAWATTRARRRSTRGVRAGVGERAHPRPDLLDPVEPDVPPRPGFVLLMAGRGHGPPGRLRGRAGALPGAVAPGGNRREAQIPAAGRLAR